MSSDASSSGVALEGLDHVEDYIWANEGAGSLSWDRFSHVFDLVQNGNQAFRENHFEEDWPIPETETASASEYKPLNGLDPTMHAELALKDAEKVMNFRNNSVNPYILKANALILLEKYELARDVVLSGLQVDPFSNPLQASLRNLERLAANTLRRSLRNQNCDSEQHHRKNFPEEYADRKSEHESLTNFGVDLIPLFVMDVVIPCQKFPLHIFEPRYRLMVRRMEGNHRMGMVVLDSTAGSIVDFACEVEITECEPLPDGRLSRVESRRRFRILRSWDQDGYRVAEVDWVQDDPPKRRAELVTLSDRKPYEKLELLRIRDTEERINEDWYILEQQNRATGYDNKICIWKLNAP
ncbi:hypothetical protein GH714_040862 [Hevea brasiliensis]|uniref:Lon N-terminal domain-containing protein n=1 Tax=Hevea brasiliensis TaxID=3981 RepID=A0A6A6MSR6_HEVBR|nr:hypothetical protein GH714_040862 [Hevea brasiliensis]